MILINPRNVPPGYMPTVLSQRPKCPQPDRSPRPWVIVRTGSLGLAPRRSRWRRRGAQQLPASARLAENGYVISVELPVGVGEEHSGAPTDTVVAA